MPRTAKGITIKPGDQVRLISLKDRDKLARYYSEPPTRIGDVGRVIGEHSKGVFVCGFVKYALLVNSEMVKVIE